MGFWSFLTRGKGATDEPQPLEPVATRAPAGGDRQRSPNDEARAASSDAATSAARDIDKLTRTGLAGGPTTNEALYLFAQLRATPDEAQAVLELIRTTQTRLLPEPLLLALASALVDRGELDVAARARGCDVVAGARSAR
jgi:hypothetical protein